MSQPRVAIIIINWNGHELTRNCLISLRDIQYKNFKIILVDNASSDGSGNRLKDEFKEVIFIQNKENLGFAGGNNVGIQHALDQDFEYIMLLNNDTETEKNFLTNIIKSSESKPGVGAIQPKMYFMHDKSKIWNAGGSYIRFLGLPITRGENSKNKEKYDWPWETDWITGCCFMVKTSVIQEVGILNNNYFIYFEDVDWSFRIKAAGYKLYYEPSSVIYHHAGMSNKKKVKGKEGYLNPHVHYLNIRNNIWLIKKYVPWYFIPSAFIFHLLKFSAYLTYFLARSRFVKFRYALKGIKDGLLKTAY